MAVHTQHQLLPGCAQNRSLLCAPMAWCFCISVALLWGLLTQQSFLVRDAVGTPAWLFPDGPMCLDGDCCWAGQMLCVSEYLPNGSLEDLIRKDNERKHGKPRQLGWFRHGRSIATDVASGLAFLHGHRVLPFVLLRAFCD